MTAPWTTADIPDQTGRTFIVTGANSGLGFATVQQLAWQKARVVMAVRNLDKGRAAAERIIAAQPDADLEVRHIDLGDLDSVRAFAADYTGPVDVLVNNAGISAPPRSLSPQGHESQFAANHLGHFALTGLLIDRIAQGRDARVVTVAALVSRRAEIFFDDLAGERIYAPWAYYAQSKLANVLFGLELHRRLTGAARPIRSVVAHPGLSVTNLDRSASRPRRMLARLVLPMVAQPVEDGAMPQLFAATAPEAESGRYIGPDGRRETKGHPVPVDLKPHERDPESAARLWAISEELTGVRFPLPAPPGA